MFRIIRKKTGNKATADIDKYAIVPKLTYKLLKKYNYCSPYTSNVSNYNRYLHVLLQFIGEEFNDTVITEVRMVRGDPHHSHSAGYFNMIVNRLQIC